MLPNELLIEMDAAARRGWHLRLELKGRTAEGWADRDVNIRLPIHEIAEHDHCTFPISTVIGQILADIAAYEAAHKDPAHVQA